MVLGACAAGAGAASADSSFEFSRIGGVDRYDTSTLVSDAYNEVTPDVILANGEPGSYADALTANYLAGVKKAPILLTKKDTTPAIVKKQLVDAKVKNITVVGGVGVVSAKQIAALEADGYKVDRVSGGDRFDTNAAVIKAGGNADGTLGIIATGFDFPDALGAAPLSYDGIPLGLSTKDSVDQDVIDALKAAGVTRVLIAGGTGVVGVGVEAKLIANGIKVEERLAGVDRSSTSVKIAEWAVAHNGFTNEAVNVASGYTQGDGADALAGGVLTGEQERPLLITRGVNDPDNDVLDYLRKNANTLSEGIIFGGPGAVSAAAEDAMEKAAQTVTTNQDFTVSPDGAIEKTVSSDVTKNEGAVTFSFGNVDKAVKLLSSRRAT